MRGAWRGVAVAMAAALAAPAWSFDSFSDVVEVAGTRRTTVTLRRCKQSERERTGGLADQDPAECTQLDAKTFRAARIRIVNLGPGTVWVHIGHGTAAVLPGHTFIRRASTAYGIDRVVLSSDEGKWASVNVFASDPSTFE